MVEYEKFINRFSTENITTNEITPQIYIKPYPFLPSKDYLSKKKTTFGKCKVVNRARDSKKGILDSYNPFAIGQPYANQLYNGYNWTSEDTKMKTFKTGAYAIFDGSLNDNRIMNDYNLRTLGSKNDIIQYTDNTFNY